MGTAWLGAALALLGLLACSAEAGGLEQPAAAVGRHLLADTCATQGLDGTCVGKCCCCYAGGAGIVTYKPDDNCQCQRVVDTSQIWATVVLSIIVVLGGLLVQLYFGSSLPVSPYQRAANGQAPRSQRSSVRVTPNDAPLRQQHQQQPPAVLATV